MAALRRDFGSELPAPYMLVVLVAVEVVDGPGALVVLGRALIETEYAEGRRVWLALAM